MAVFSSIQRFIRHESAGGIVLMVATALALFAANGPFASSYLALLHIPVMLHVDKMAVGMSLSHWINDGLMAIFFFLVGLELKRELLEGELANIRKAAVPVFAAAGGMLVPALIYFAVAYDDPLARRGWAIPMATDIAFALGILTLLGRRIPTGLKVFLVSLAIIDDLGAVLIIALFYSHGFVPLALIAASVCIVLLFTLNRFWVTDYFPYLLLSVALWVAVLNSGIHATVAGVVAAFFIPLHNRHGRIGSPLRSLEESLHSTVVFGVLPLFAFFNAGVPLEGLSVDALFGAVPLGIILGLFVGKQLGVFSFAWLAVKLGIGSLPDNVNWHRVYGVAVLCGIGFTMSLFVSGLAFVGESVLYSTTSRLGILLGSALSAVIGYGLLRFMRE